MKLKLQEAQELSYMDANGSVHGLLFDTGTDKAIFTADLSVQERLTHVLDEYRQIGTMFKRTFIP